MRRRIRAVSVVVPARDEEALLPAALTGLLDARAALETSARHVDVACRIVVVLDRCVDSSARIAAEYSPAVRSVEIDAGAVGAARAAGVDLALASGAVPPEAHWLCSTDADSVVPPTWLIDHLDAAEGGAALTLGRVAPSLADLPPGAFELWAAGYESTRDHVHGANLGVRADVYSRLGGFAPVAEHEDVSLAALARAAGERIVVLDRSIVITSGRLDGRTPGGFSGYLQAQCLSPDPL